MKKKFRVVANSDNTRSVVYAADDDEFMADNFDDFNEDDAENPDLDETVEDLADTAEDLHDAVDSNIEEDDPSIQTDNNIESHYIAECDECGGIFVSAVLHSDQTLNSISGICPLCGKESEQHLKWVIVPTEDYNKLAQSAKPEVK